MDADDLMARLGRLEREHEETERRLRRFEDIEEIMLLKHRYWRAVDTADGALLASLLTEDFTAHLWGGAFELRASSRDDFVESILSIMTEHKAAQHHGHHPEIVIEGEDEARGVWYLQDLVYAVDTQELVFGTCFYRDRYARTTEGWKLAHTAWGRHVEVRQTLPQALRFTDRYLGDHGRSVG